MAWWFDSTTGRNEHVAQVNQIIEVMKTKLFLIEEHVETIFNSEEIEKWSALVEELGLTKQAELIKPTKSPIPFPVFTEAESAIYGKVLDSQVDYKNYGGEAIPLPVLSLIALSEKEGYFERIEIWYSRSNPDPICVGRRYASDSDRENGYNWRMLVHPIAQWGPKLASVKTLLPIYDKVVREEIQHTYDYHLAEHVKKMQKFNFQMEAFGQVIED